MRAAAAALIWALAAATAPSAIYATEEAASAPDTAPAPYQHIVQLVSDGAWSMDTPPEEAPVCVGDTVVVRPPPVAVATASSMVWYETAAPSSCAPKPGGYTWRPSAGKNWNPKLAGEHWFVASNV